MDEQAKHDLEWVGIWFAITLVFALVGHFGRNALWIVALVTGTILFFYGVASFNAWRDRLAETERDGEDNG